MSNYKEHTICRVCGSTELKKYIDLGLMPLSNNLCNIQQQEVDRYPLEVLFCDYCSLSQLSIVIDPQVLFGHYVYHSSISKGYRDHCRAMAKQMRYRYDLTSESFVIDIAGNDGALLYEFMQEIPGLRTLNIDPAINLVQENSDKGIRMFSAFWGYNAANHLINTHWPKADLITATNVFAHVDDVKEFLEAVKLVLKPTGVLVLEFPYLVDFIEKMEFDTIYHEHLSYFSIWPLVQLCNSCSLNILHVEKQKIHGGSVRVIIGKGRPDISVNQFIQNETKFRIFKTYQDWSCQVAEIIDRFRNELYKLSHAGKVIAGFAASAKGNTLLNCAGIDNKLVKFIIDQTPEKINKFSPGTHIPIVHIDILQFQSPDYIILLSWNFADECMKKCRDAGYKGKFIMPLTFEII